ncbi:hypothetical protein BJF78_03095 [Pseudonocardia sp. CNS-139]|nr:hypothetical protein BJF78_03095 [Pseudonocardia sp. CNS-139]
MAAPLLHIVTPGEWRAALAAGAVAPPSLAEVGFVHLSTPEQVALPADRLYAGRTDLALLVLDPDRIGVPVRHEPGVPTDPASMRFPHAYGPVPAAAVLGVLPYRPGPDGFEAPAIPAVDDGWRHAVLERSVLRRAATGEEPVAGGVAVLTAAVPASHGHNQLLIDAPVPSGVLAAETDRVLGGAGLTHRQAQLVGAHLAGTAAALAADGWDVTELVGMAAPAGGAPDPRVEPLDLDALRPMWAAGWEREVPGLSADVVDQLADRYAVEDAVVDVRYLGVRMDGRVVASALVKIDGATALLDTVLTDPAARGRGLGDALVSTALALAADAGCDLVVLDADAADWPRRWYGRRGFAEVGRTWSARR